MKQQSKNVSGYTHASNGYRERCICFFFCVPGIFRLTIRRIGPANITKIMLRHFYTILSLRCIRNSSSTCNLALIPPIAIFTRLIDFPTAAKLDCCSKHINFCITKYEKNQVWWHNLINKWPNNNSFINTLLGRRYKNTELDEEIVHIKSDASLRHFLSSPESIDPRYTKWL